MLRDSLSFIQKSKRKIQAIEQRIDDLACDLLIMESTYGDRNHESRNERVEVLKRCLTRVLGAGGIVYIPVFSLERTQELI